MVFSCDFKWKMLLQEYIHFDASKLNTLYIDFKMHYLEIKFSLFDSCRNIYIHLSNVQKAQLHLGS